MDSYIYMKRSSEQAEEIKSTGTPNSIDLNETLYFNSVAEKTIIIQE